MRQLFVLLLSVCFSGIFIACNPRIPAVAEPGEIELFPDYRGVTIPANIAPLNFKIVNEQYDGIIRLKTCENEFVITADKGVINIPLKVWRLLIIVRIKIAGKEWIFLFTSRLIQLTVI